MNEDLEHLERNLHALVAVARTLARDADAVSGDRWNEPYAYQSAQAALSAVRNLRRQLETRWLVTPLDRERPSQEDEPQHQQAYPESTSCPHVIGVGATTKRTGRARK
jgi:hypothetical protein